MTNDTITRKIVLKKTVADYRRELKIAELKFRVSELEITIAEYTSGIYNLTGPSMWLTALDNSDKALAVLNHAKDSLELALMAQPF